MYFLEFSFLFMSGSMLGWVLELIYRNVIAREAHGKKWINPGFLTGPYVPLYGFGLCILFLLSDMPVGVQSRFLCDIIHVLVMSAAMTLIEYIAGLIFIKGMKVKLWDYSKNRGNIRGIICPLFSFFWTVLAAIYYFFVNPSVSSSILWFTDNIWFSYFVGMFTGIFILDFSASLNLMTKIRSWAKENNVVILTEEFKRHVFEFKEDHHIGGKFIFPMTGLGSVRDRLEEYIDKVISKRDKQ